MHGGESEIESEMHGGESEIGSEGQGINVFDLLRIIFNYS
jgi:hypothetical protein